MADTAENVTPKPIKSESARGRAFTDPGSARDHQLNFTLEPLRRGLFSPAILKFHYDESCPAKHLLRLEPDWDFYDQATERGETVCVTARDHLGTLVGYIVMILRRHPHYADTILAVDDLHFLLPEFRGRGAGKLMLAFAEEKAREAGARVFSMRCKADSNHGFIFESMGYKLTDLVYIKELAP
jgi:GNAT superfamily N-acetyltransferase